VPERLNGRDWKSRNGGNFVRGFESLPLRFFVSRVIPDVCLGSSWTSFGDAKYSQWQKLRCLLRHWDAIAALLDTPGPQAGVLYLSSFRAEILS
jgi:hypothetical protein